MHTFPEKLRKAEEWSDWRWQLSNSITTVGQLEHFTDLTDEEHLNLPRVLKKLRMRITPYYASLMDPEDLNDPIRLQAVASILELSDTQGEDDPMSEDSTTPVKGVLQRYPDRICLLVTNECASFCRFCQRKRRIATRDYHASDEGILNALAYVRSNKDIRDVLVTGGDPLMMTNDRLDWVLSEIEDIPQVEIKRIGTRTPVVLPQRITHRLTKMLSRHHPLWINTHFNHPVEVTEEAAQACAMLADAGIPLGNQTVLLKGVNDSVEVLEELFKKLVQIRVRPYYLFQCNPVRGINHFRTPVKLGIEIIKQLQGRISGLCIPRFVVNIPGGKGKIPLQPRYFCGEDEDTVYLRTWRGEVIPYPNGN